MTREATNHLRVGELAKRTGLTVRALHHYDALGILSPRRRSAAGYRLYGEDDVARLLQALLLRRLGLSLPEVRACLDDPRRSLPAALRAQATRLRQQIAHEQRLLTRLDSLASSFENGRGAATDDLLQTLEMLTMFEKYLDDEQRAALAARGESLGAEHIAAVEAEWPRLIAAVRSAMERGVDPAAPELVPLMQRWGELVRQFTGGDPAIASGVRRMYANEPAVRQRTGLDEGIMEYVARAMAAGKSTG
ncbi:MAG TPA: MerR family transcriptional regulator [Thermoanaerobaculia bacterium]|nr:MerR family transcriptional regulator [Thermoanaerobaculia bacterium]